MTGVVYSVETVRQTAVMSFFPQIQNGEQKAYVLKNKQLTGPTKGVIYLELDVIFNAVSLNFVVFFYKLSTAKERFS